MSDKRNIIPQSGERAFIAGQTGGGKTAFAVWMLLRMQQTPIIIYETKEEPKFLVFPNMRVVRTQAELTEAYHDQEIDYIVVRPELDVVIDPNALDEMLFYHWFHYRNSVAYVDEAYMFHNNGRHGRGLVALYTRGRSAGITTIMATQRPSWISNFTISESQRYYAFYLEMEADKKKLKPALVDLPDPPKFGFYYWESGQKFPTRYGAVKLAKGLDTGYTDPVSSIEQSASETETATPDAVVSKKRGALFF